MTKTPRLVRLHPVEGVSLYPWPAVEFDATPEQWEELSRHVPCPFTVDPTPAEAAPPEIGDD